MDLDFGLVLQVISAVKKSLANLSSLISTLKKKP